MKNYIPAHNNIFTDKKRKKKQLNDLSTHQPCPSEENNQKLFSNEIFEFPLFVVYLLFIYFFFLKLYKFTEIFCRKSEILENIRRKKEKRKEEENWVGKEKGIAGCPSYGWLSSILMYLDLKSNIFHINKSPYNFLYI